MNRLLALIGLTALSIAVVSPVLSSSYTRNYDFTPNTVIQSDQIDEEFNDISTAVTDNANRITTIESGTLTIGGSKTFSSNIKVDGIDEKTTNSGVTIDGAVLVKDGAVTLNSSTASAPTINGTITVERGSSTDTVIRYNETDDRWEGTDDGSTYYGMLDGWHKIECKTASNSASVAFTSGIDSTYHIYKIEMSGVYPTTSGTSLQVQYGDAASGYRTASYLYHTSLLSSASNAYNGQVSSVAAGIILATNMGNANTKAYNGVITFREPSVNQRHHPTYQGGYQTALGNAIYAAGGGQYGGNMVLDRVRFLMSSGNISAGKFCMYGLRD